MLIFVWKTDNDYIILSGHNRVEACKIAKITEIPCIIKNNLTLEEATIIVTETNLMQRFLVIYQIQKEPIP